MEIPNWASRHLKKEDLDHISRVIAEAERATSAEIVPMVVRSSSAVGHVPFLMFLLGASGLWAADTVLLHTRESGLPLVFWLVALTALFLLASRLAELPWFQRFFTATVDMRAQVERRAELEFFEAGIGQTAGRTGILIFISLMEHRAVVLADRAIAEKYEPETWRDIVEGILNGIRSGNFAAGLTTGIRSCGEICARDFKAAAEDRNELKNQLVIKE